MSAAEKDGESGGRLATVRHAHLLGLIGRSHYFAQAQAEESVNRRRLDWDRGYTIFTSSAKRKAEKGEAKIKIIETWQQCVSYKAWLFSFYRE